MATTLVDGSITADQLGLFLRDGYLVVRGLFDETELQSVTEGCEELSSDRPGLYFGTILKGAMFDNKAFWSMAVHSKMPKIAAELMQLNEKNQSVRILRYVARRMIHSSVNT